MMARLLNIGCGSRFHVDWVNIDFAPVDPAIIKCDIRKGLPFHSNEFDAVYHSHVLEHLPRAEARPFLSECCRLLKPKGLIRIVVPDLEQIAREYLKWLESALRNDPLAEENYDWIMLELYDQVVRVTSGGGMLAYLRTRHVNNLRFVRERCGDAIADIAVKPTAHCSKEGRRWLAWLRSRRPREVLVALVLGKEYEVLKEARFAQTGERHQWMYDKFALTRLVREIGFSHIQVVPATESGIPMWSRYALDAGPDGRPYKPDSLYLEAQKP
jgi:predicted SAM-dependent methyltransferase